VSGFCVGLRRRRLGHLFGYLPILYQIPHSPSFVITLKRMIANDEWQVLTTIVLNLICQCHEIINQKSQFVAWIEAGTSRNWTHSLTLRQSSGMEIFALFCVSYYELQGGYSDMDSCHYLIFLWHHTQHFCFNPFLVFETYLVLFPGKIWIQLVLAINGESGTVCSSRQI